jgi:peptidoglycan hydrolase CwlO-like protein
LVSVRFSAPSIKTGARISMQFADRHHWFLRVFAITAVIAVALLGSDLVPRSSGDLQGQIDASRSAASSLKSQIAADTAQIQQTSGGLQAAQQRLASLQSELSGREAQLRAVQNSLLAARDHLVELENRLQQSSHALASNLLAAYESSQPDVVTVILESHGFKDLLERMSFLQRIGHQDAQIVGNTRTARAAVSAEATALAALEQRDRSLTNQVLSQRNDVAALSAALLNRQISQLSARSSDAAKLHDLNGRLHTLEAKAAAQAAAAAAAGNAAVGGIAVNTGGMVQPPAGAPAAVAQVMAAGNAIATLPYIWGGGHGSFQASGYDCSGSVSYALAAAGLLSSPLDSTGFESWGQPGPGQWITVYANAGHAFMVVGGWRFDTVALAQGGTRWSQSMADTSGFVVRHPAGL